MVRIPYAGTSASFSRADLMHFGGGVGLSRVAFAAGVEVGAFLHEFLRLCETDQPQLAADRVDAAHAFQHADAAIGIDGDFLVGRLEYDRAAGAEHRVAGRRHQLALRIDLQIAVAGVALAAGGLHDQKTLAVDCNV
jgi:hypothetical protein